MTAKVTEEFFAIEPMARLGINLASKFKMVAVCYLVTMETYSTAHLVADILNVIYASAAMLNFVL